MVLLLVGKLASDIRTSSFQIENQESKIITLKERYIKPS